MRFLPGFFESLRRNVVVTLASLFVSLTVCAQSEVEIQVLAWNKSIDSIEIQTVEGAEPVNARRGQITAPFTVFRETGVAIRETRAEGTSPDTPSAIRLQLGIPAEVREAGLLLLAEDSGELRGRIVPFSEEKMPYNSLTIFNFTQFPVASEIDGVRQVIAPRDQVSLPYKYVAIENEALKTRFAVQTEDGWDLVQNGFIPTVANGRILFFISEDMPSSSARRIRPVRFTYVFEVQDSKEAKKARDQIEFVDPSTGYDPPLF